MNAMAAAQTAPVTNLGLTRNETKRFSVLRAIKAMADKDWKGAAFELECSQEICKRAGIPTTGKQNPEFLEWLMGFPIGHSARDR